MASMRMCEVPTQKGKNKPCVWGIQIWGAAAVVRTWLLSASAILLAAAILTCGSYVLQNGNLRLNQLRLQRNLWKSVCEARGLFWALPHAAPLNNLLC